MDKLKEYRLKNPLQIDIFHYLKDVKREDAMIPKGKLRLKSNSPMYAMYGGIWLNIVDIDNKGRFLVESKNSKFIVNENEYELYEHYIKEFRPDVKNLNDNYSPIIQDEFEILLNNRIELINRSLVVKGEEYCGNGRTDRMHNFITAAKRSGDTPEKALDGMLAKHLISYQDIIKDLDSGIIPSKETIIEKYGDIINYFILSEMLLLKRLD
jgi:hypothetical protein